MFKIKNFEFLEGLKPSEMLKLISETVIDQDEAIKKLSLSIYNHYKRMQINQEKNTNLVKNNILMIGETGSGKTLLIKKLQELYNIPVFITSATEYTAEGYVGKSVNEIIENLYNETDSIGLTESSIVFIDEIDKIANKRSNGIDVNGEEVQNALLKLIEGSEAIIKIEDLGIKEKIIIDTSNILFICAGAFSGIDKIVEKRTKPKNSIGFISDNKNKDNETNIKIEDISNYGFKKEFLGRFNTVIQLNKLNEKSLVDILLNSSDSILKDFKLRFNYENCDFKISRYALIEIAKIAIKNGTGARGLNKVFYDIFTDSLSECINNNCLNKKINVNKKDIINNKIRVEYDNI